MIRGIRNWQFHKLNMKGESTFQTFPFCSRTASLLVLLLPLITFTTEDKADSDANLLTSTMPSSSPSLNQLMPSKLEREQLHLLSPKKLALFAKALHKVVQARCPKVDDLELDAFQAYLNRQILKGEVQTLRHALHFNSLYQALTGCADFLSSPSARVMIALDHYLDDHGDEEKSNQGSSIPPTSTSQTDDMGLLPSSTQSSTSGSSTSSESGRNDSGTRTGEKYGTTNDTSGGGLPLTTQTGSGADTGMSSDKSSTTHPKEVVTSEPSPIKKTSTVLDKLVHNATDITKQVVYNTGSFFGKLLFGVFGRKKRDLFNVMGKVEESESNSEKRPSSYSKSPISLPPQLENKNQIGANDADNNYNEVWKSVSAEETKMAAYAHVSIMIKNFISVTVDGCSKTFPIEEIYLSKICELMATQVMKDLVEAESQGMMLMVDDKLENDLQLCVDNISARAMLQ